MTPDPPPKRLPAWLLNLRSTLGRLTVRTALIRLIPFLPLLAIGPLSAQYNVYYGNLHSHTANSDGVGTPTQAFAYARDSAHLDFLAVTDHVEYLYFRPWQWIQCKNAADAATVDGAFVGMAGYEWTDTADGHCNVFNTPNLVLPYLLSDWDNFPTNVVNQRPALAQFNHPGADLGFTNWWQFAYRGAAVDTAFALMEIRVSIQDSFYRQALDSGWHVSPVTNQDNHDADWGTQNENRAGIWASALNRPALVEAMAARRTFAPWDGNAWIWLEVNGAPMGSSLERGYNMAVHIRLGDGDGESWQYIDLIGPEGYIRTIYDHPSDVDTTLFYSPINERWLYVRARQPDYDRIWSAPIFLIGPPLTVAARSQAIRTFSGAPNPAFGVISLPSSGAPVSFYDAAGKDVTGSVRRLPEDRYEVSALPPGTYLARIDSFVCRFIHLP